MNMFVNRNSNDSLKMIDITNKKQTVRSAKAEGIIDTKAEVIKLIKENKIMKGNVLLTAQIAGILAAKNVSRLIPLCHPIILNHIDIRFKMKSKNKIRIESSVSTIGRTGPDVEALTAVSITCLTIYDMCKSIDRDMAIEKICLVEKTGGRSGVYRRKRG